MASPSLWNRRAANSLRRWCRRNRQSESQPLGFLRPLALLLHTVMMVSAITALIATIYLFIAS